MQTTLIKIPNPLQPEINNKEIIYFDETIRLDQCLKDLPLDENINFVVAINGDTITDKWVNVEVNDGDIISVVANTEFTVAAMAAAAVSGVTVTSVAGFAALAATFAGTALIYGATYLAALFVMGYGMSLLTSALAPDAPSVDLRDNTVYGWGQQQNIMREGLHIPLLYGTNRVAGQVISQYIDVVDNDEILSILYGVCDHEVDSIEDIQINDQPTSFYKDIEIFTRMGTSAGESIGGFDDIPLQTNVSIDLEYNDPWVVRETIGNQVEALRIYVTAPRGVYHVNSEGDKGEAAVGVAIEYSVKGSGAWINTGGLTFRGTTSDPQRKVKVVENLTPAQYEIRVMSTATRAAGGNEVWDTNFSSFMEVTYASLSYPGIAKYAIKALATNQLSGGMPNVTALVSKDTVQIYDESLATPALVAKRATNPAWIVWDLLYNHADIPVNRILWDEFKAWADYCDEDVEGDYRFKVNTIIHSGNFWEQIQKISRMGRATILRRGTAYGVFVDKYEGATPTISHLFNSGNIIKDTFKIQYLIQKDRAAAVEIEYSDVDKEYTRQIVTVQPNDDYPDQIANVQLQASITKAEAVREGIFRVNCNKHLHRVIEFDASVDSFACVVGDLFYFQHDLIDPDSSVSGRVVSATNNTLTLDKEVTIESGTYEVMVRHTNGTIETKTVSTGPNTVSTINLTSNWSTIPSEYDLYTFGKINTYKKIYRLTNVSRSSDLERTLVGIEYVPEIYTDNDSFIIEDTTPPEYVSVDQRAVNVRLSEDIGFASDGSYRSMLICSWGSSVNKVNTLWDVWLEDTTEGFVIVDNPTFTGTGGSLGGGGGTLTGTLPDNWKVWTAGTVTTTRNTDGTITLTSTQAVDFYSAVNVTTIDGENYRLSCEIRDITGGSIEASIQEADYSNFLLTDTISSAGLYHFSGTEDTPDDKVVLFHIPANVEVTFVFAQGLQEGISSLPIKMDSTTSYHTRIQTDLVIGHLYKAYVVPNGESPLDTGQNTAYITIKGKEFPPEDVLNFEVSWNNIHRSVNFTWSHVNDIDLNYYEIRQGSVWDTATHLLTTKDNNASYFEKDTVNQAVTYLIKAVDYSGVKSVNATSYILTFDTKYTPLSTPTGLTWTSTSNIGNDGTDQVLIEASWDATTHDEFAHYVVMVIDNVSTKVSVFMSATNSHQIFALPNHSYTLSVAAVDKNGNYTAYSTGVTDTTTKDTAPPNDPNTLSAGGTFTSIILQWDHGAEADLDHFIVYRNTTNNSGTAVSVGNAVKEFSGSLAMFNDTPPTSDTYYYWVKAVDTSGNVSGFSNVASASAPGVDATIGPNSITETEIADDAITTPKLSANSVVAYHIDGKVIGADQIVAGSITAAEMSVTELSAITADLGTVTAGYLQNSTNTTWLNLNNGTISVGGGALSWNGSVLSIGSSSTLDGTNVSSVVDGANYGSGIYDGTYNAYDTARVDGAAAATVRADAANASTFISTTYPADKSNLEDQIDGKIDTWYTSTDPSGSWSGTNASHEGDMWWNTSTKVLKRYSGTAWSAALTDQTAIDAYADAATAQDTADGKRRVFVATPTTPYDIGDLWDRGTTTGIWRCKTTRAAGTSHSVAYWQAIADYTSSNTSYDTSRVNGTWASTVKNNAAAGATFTSTDAGSLSYLDLVQTAQLGDTIITGGYIKTDLINTGAILIGDLSDGTTLQNDVNSKARTFTTWSTLPVPPYDTGDLWVRGSHQGLYLCVQSRSSGATAYWSDWDPRADKTSEFTSANTNAVNGTAASTVVTNAANGNTGYTRTESWKYNETYINGGNIYTGTVNASQINTNALSTAKFYCSDSNSTAYSTYKSYTTTGVSTVALGAVNTYTGYAEAIFGKCHGSSTANGIRGICDNGNGVVGQTDTGRGIYGIAYNNGGVGVEGKSPQWAVNGVTTNADGYWGLITQEKCYAADGFTPFTGSHLCFTKQTMQTGDIVFTEGSLLIGISEAFPFIGLAQDIQNKAVIGVVANIEDKPFIDSDLFKTIKSNKKLFDTKPINEREVVYEEDNPDRGIKKGDTQLINDGYEQILKSEHIQKTETSKDKGLLHPDTLGGVIDSQEYQVAEVNALGEGGINVCSAGGDIAIGDYICSSNIPGKGMKQADDILHNYTVAKALEAVIWGNETENIKMIACTYHCG